MNQKHMRAQRRSATRGATANKRSQRGLYPETAAQILDLIGCPPAEACRRVIATFPRGTPRSRGSAPGTDA